MLGAAAPSMAQDVSRVQVGDNQNYGITYQLPATQVMITAEARCTQFKAGVFAQYAEKYLGLTDVPMEDATTWTLLGTSMQQQAVRDTARTYHIIFSDKAPAPTFWLSDGCLLAINREPVEPTAAEVPAAQPAEQKTELHATSVMNEELLKAGSRSKQAEIAARQIFRIRESRLNLLTGDVDNLPADGASFQMVLDNLQAQEAAYMELFTGTTTTSTQQRTFTFRPVGEGKTVLFRFSQHFGFVDADDLAGEPYYMMVTVTDDRRQVPVLLDAKGKPKPVATGVAYTVPGKARLELTFKGTTLTQAEWSMGQFGHVEFLSAQQFTNKKVPASALFDAQTGEIRQLTVGN